MSEKENYIPPLAKLIPLGPLRELPEPLLLAVTGDDDYALQQWGVNSTGTSASTITGGGGWDRD